MKNRTKLKRITDILMTFILFGLMAFQYTGELAHECLGAAMLFLFLTHNFLNRGWYRSLGKGKYNAFRILLAAVNLLLLADMLGMMASGIAMSRHVFSFLPIYGGQYEARLYHLAGSHWGVLLMSVHLGLHWGMMMSMGRKLSGRELPRIVVSALRAAAFLIACNGVVSFWQQGFYVYLFLTNEFLIWDSGRTVFQFLVQEASIMGTCIFLTYYGGKMLQKKQRVTKVQKL